MPAFPQNHDELHAQSQLQQRHQQEHNQEHKQQQHQHKWQMPATKTFLHQEPLLGEQSEEEIERILLANQVLVHQHQQLDQQSEEGLAPQMQQQVTHERQAELFERDSAMCGQRAHQHQQQQQQDKLNPAAAEQPKGMPAIPTGSADAQGIHFRMLVAAVALQALPCVAWLKRPMHMRQLAAWQDALPCSVLAMHASASVLLVSASTHASID